MDADLRKRGQMIVRQSNLPNPALVAEETYHRNRAEEERQRADAANCDGARAAHDELEKLHLDEVRKLQQIVTIRCAVREHLG